MAPGTECPRANRTSRLNTDADLLERCDAITWAIRDTLWEIARKISSRGSFGRGLLPCDFMITLAPCFVIHLLT